MKFTIAPWLRKMINVFSFITILAVLTVSCRKNNDLAAPPVNTENNEAEAVNAARLLETNALLDAQKLAEAEGFSDDLNTQTRGGNRNIVQIVVSTNSFSALEAAVIKTGLAGALSNLNAELTVFAPTNNAFNKLPAPFNNAANISNITDPAQIAALSNILRYHVTTSRYFAWDLGILSRITTAADAPNNKVTTVLGFNQGWVRGDGNNSFSKINPADILTTNGVVHVIDKVLLP